VTCRERGERERAEGRERGERVETAGLDVVVVCSKE